MSKSITEIAAAVSRAAVVAADDLTNGLAAMQQPAEPPAVTLEELEALAIPGDLPDGAPAPREFRIADDKCADWALRRIAEERREFARLKELADSQIEAIQIKVEAAEKRLQSGTAFLLGHLGRYFDTVEHRQTKTQETYRLLSGTLLLKRGKVKTEQDDEKLVAWLKANGYSEYIKQTEAPKWGELKEKLNLVPDSVVTIADTGELVDGVTVTQGPDTFDVKV